MFERLLRGRDVYEFLRLGRHSQIERHAERRRGRDTGREERDGQ